MLPNPLKLDKIPFSQSSVTDMVTYVWFLRIVQPSCTISLNWFCADVAASFARSTDSWFTKVIGNVSPVTSVSNWSWNFRPVVGKL